MVGTRLGVGLVVSAVCVVCCAKGGGEERVSVRMDTRPGDAGVSRWIYWAYQMAA